MNRRNPAGWLLARLSLRARLLLVALGLLTAALLVSNTAVVALLDRYQTERLDRQIRPVAEIAATAPYQAVVGSDGETPEPPAREYAEAIGEIVGFSYLAYLRPDGSVVERAWLPQWLSQGTGPVLAGLDAQSVAAQAGEPFDLPGPEGTGRWRAVAAPLAPSAQPPGADLTVVVATSRAEADATVTRLRTITLVVGAAVLALLVVVGWYAVGAGLRPLRRIEDTAAGIAGGDLARRVPETAPPHTEIGRLSQSLNRMLTQLEQAFAARANSEARMRRFVADVSHELRTPLFGIHGFTELYRMGGLPERADVDRTMDRIERESARLARLAEDLLLLARLDEESAAGVQATQLAPMDLRTLAADAYHDLRALDPSRPVTLTGPAEASASAAAPASTANSPAAGPAGSAPVNGDEAQLRQVVANLVGNAVAHTPPGTPVRIGVGTLGEEAVLELADDGPGLTAEQAARAFDRFYRADDSRTRTTGAGAGLGLSIARSLVEAHGGRVELVTAPGRGARFRIVLPAIDLDREDPSRMRG